MKYKTFQQLIINNQNYSLNLMALANHKVTLFKMYQKCVWNEAQKKTNKDVEN